MSKTRADFCVESNEPSGTTFENAGFPKLAGSSNKKRPDDFGVEVGDFDSVTGMGKSHIDMPDADRKPNESKVLSTKSGDYDPEDSGPEDFGGSVAVGASSPKRGRGRK